MEVPACRACLATNTLLYSLSENTLRKAFENIIGFEISLSKEFPKDLCYICRARVVKYSLYQKKCVQIQKFLETQSVVGEALTKDILDSIHNSYPNLQLTKTEIEIYSNNAQLNTETLNEIHDLKYDDKDDVCIEQYHDPDSEDEKSLSELIRIKEENQYLFDVSKVINDDNIENEITDKINIGKCVKVKRKTVKRATRHKKCDDMYSNEIEEKSKKKVAKKNCIGKLVKDKVKSDDNELKIKRREKNYYDIARTALSMKQYNMKVKMFTREEQLQQFLARKESPGYKNARHKCDSCYKGFATQSAYKAHLELHKADEKRPYECELCHMYFSKKSSRRRHFEQHDREFTCMQCGERVINSALRIHYRYHSGVKYECKICGKIFSRHTTHQNHMRIAHGDTRCRICDDTFFGDTGLKYHMDKKHREATECNTCHILFNDKKALQKHLHNCSDESQYSQHCARCGDSFPSSDHLLLHLKTHRAETTHQKETEAKRKRSEEKANFVCDLCGQTVTTRQSLVWHLRTHSGEKPHACRHCGKAFRILQTLKNHVRIHTGERPYKCKLCPKDFRQVVHLSNHMLIHRSQKPHSCAVCQKSFRVVWALKEHARTVHAGLPAARKHRARARAAPHHTDGITPVQ